MTPDQLIRAMAVIVEECAQGLRDRVTGGMQPMSKAELVAVRERVDTLIVMNLPREINDGN